MLPNSAIDIYLYNTWFFYEINTAVTSALFIIILSVLISQIIQINAGRKSNLKNYFYGYLSAVFYISFGVVSSLRIILYADKHRSVFQQICMQHSFIIIFFTVLIILGVGILYRKRWAWILNAGLGYLFIVPGIINTLYAKNRWHEFSLAPSATKYATPVIVSTDNNQESTTEGEEALMPHMEASQATEKPLLEVSPPELVVPSPDLREELSAEINKLTALNTKELISKAQLEDRIFRSVASHISRIVKTLSIEDALGFFKQLERASTLSSGLYEKISGVILEGYSESDATLIKDNEDVVASKQNSGHNYRSHSTIQLENPAESFVSTKSNHENQKTKEAPNTASDNQAGHNVEDASHRHDMSNDSSKNEATSPEFDMKKQVKQLAKETTVTIFNKIALAVFTFGGGILAMLMFDNKIAMWGGLIAGGCIYLFGVQKLFPGLSR